MWTCSKCGNERNYCPDIIPVNKTTYLLCRNCRPVPAHVSRPLEFTEDNLACGVTMEERRAYAAAYPNHIKILDANGYQVYNWTQYTLHKYVKDESKPNKFVPKLLPRLKDRVEVGA